MENKETQWHCYSENCLLVYLHIVHKRKRQFMFVTPESALHFLWKVVESLKILNISRKTKLFKELFIYYTHSCLLVTKKPHGEYYMAGSFREPSTKMDLKWIWREISTRFLSSRFTTETEVQKAKHVEDAMPFDNQVKIKRPFTPLVWHYTSRSDSMPWWIPEKL